MQNSTSTLNLLQRAALEVIWYTARFFAILPHWFKYQVADYLIFIVLCYIVRYRRKVVVTNLRNSFPEKSARERALIARRFYRTLADAFIDTINMAHMPDRKIKKLMRIAGIEEHIEAVRGRDWIAMTAHFGCWEYISFWSTYDRSQTLVGVYHPLRNKIMNCLFQRLRQRHNTLTVTMQESMRFYLRNRENGIDGKNIVLGLIADQNPPRRPNSHWFRFLNQDTIFFDGGEKLAIRCHLPVFFLKVERVSRGRYQMSCTQIYDGKEPVEEYQITERYVRLLEEEICERPELWMWSHRRWKHKRTDVDC